MVLCLSASSLDPNACQNYYLPGSDTHYRPGPWVVEAVEAYSPDLPVETEFSEVVICQCSYQPLPTAENPWKEDNAPVVTLDSFGGDKEAFKEFLSIGIPNPNREAG